MKTRSAIQRRKAISSVATFNTQLDHKAYQRDHLRMARLRRWSLLSLLSLVLVTFVCRGATPPINGTMVAATPEPGDAQLVKPSLQHPIQDDTFYFVMLDRFRNGTPSNDRGGVAGGPTVNGFLPSDKGYYHGGDIAGLRSRLDYLQGLGVSAIWMTPIFKNRPVQGDGTIGGSSAGYHGYWITDFTQVDPHLGTNQELSDLIADAHSRGMKVFFDIITNHTADVIGYEGGQDCYRDKGRYPYKDASGNVFDDADYAGKDTFPPLDRNVSFPYEPIFKEKRKKISTSPADSTVKKPDWLNNRIYYHNRGNSTSSGEGSLYGDFFGLDDLFTEQPAVVDGMTQIYMTWIKDFGIDGFRIDTVKHVNIEFWQKFAPAILDYAKANGKPDFFMFGEVFDRDPAFVSRYTTQGRLQATLDFGFQERATLFAASSGATNDLRDFFTDDDYYTDADSNAYSLPTFLGNHDMGRFGYFLQRDTRGLCDPELLARDKLGHALMFFARGIPVVYYGDEQGFTGDGKDKDARQDMFASRVRSYNDDVLIGTNSTTAVDNYNPSHPLYQTLKTFSDIRKAHKALRRGAQIHRYGVNQPGIYAFSRIDREEKIEYIIALNNATTPQTATFKTYLANASYNAVYPPNGAAILTTDTQSQITIGVPALGFVIYKAATALSASPAAPSISIHAPRANSDLRFEVGAELGSDQFAEVTFAVKVGDGKYETIGTDNNAPYRVFYDAKAQPKGTPLTFKAIVNDLSGHLNSVTATATMH